MRAEAADWVRRLEARRLNSYSQAADADKIQKFELFSKQYCPCKLYYSSAKFTFYVNTNFSYVLAINL